MQLDPELLWATVFDGDPALGLGEDTVAIEAWKRVGIPPERIVRLPRTENFWQAGPTRAVRARARRSTTTAAPSTAAAAPTARPGCECDRYLEFWNLVFMQYDLRRATAR